MSGKPMYKRLAIAFVALFIGVFALAYPRNATAAILSSCQIKVCVSYCPDPESFCNAIQDLPCPNPPYTFDQMFCDNNPSLECFGDPNGALLADCV